MFFSFLVFSLLLGFGVSILIEAPFMALERLFLGGRESKADGTSKQ